MRTTKYPYIKCSCHRLGMPIVLKFIDDFSLTDFRFPREKKKSHLKEAKSSLLQSHIVKNIKV